MGCLGRMCGCGVWVTVWSALSAYLPRCHTLTCHLSGSCETELSIHLIVLVTASYLNSRSNIASLLICSAFRNNRMDP